LAWILVNEGPVMSWINDTGLERLKKM